MDFSAIKTLIQQNIKTNASEDITGAVLQNVLLGIINTLGDDAINDVISALNDEITNRQNAVQNEADARIAAINVVTQKINDEVQARKDEIDSLELTDSTGSAVQNDRLKVSLNVNVGTEEEPETETITELTLPSVTSQKAGLMSVQLYNKLVNLVNGGYLFGGIALPSQNPGTPQTSVFYFASGAGTYTHFKNSDNDPIVIANDGLYVFTYDNVENQYWEYNQIYNPPIGYYECDTAGGTAAKVVAAAGYQLPVSGGSIKIKMINRNTVNNATLNINSTGVKPLFYNGSRANSGNTWDNNEVIEVYYDGTNYQAHNVEGNSGDGVFDISVYNASGDPLTPAVYEDLAAALGTNGVNIPASKRKGGMSIKFIQGSVPSSDNNYVQFRLMSQSFTTDTSKWQGVDISLKSQSRNLIENGAVENAVSPLYYPLTKDNRNYCKIEKGSISITGDYNDGTSEYSCRFGTFIPISASPSITNTDKFRSVGFRYYDVNKKILSGSAAYTYTSDAKFTKAVFTITGATVDDLLTFTLNDVDYINQKYKKSATKEELDILEVIVNQLDNNLGSLEDSVEDLEELFRDEVVSLNQFDNVFDGEGYLNADTGKFVAHSNFKCNIKFYPFDKGNISRLYAKTSETVASLNIFLYDAANEDSFSVRVPLSNLTENYMNISNEKYFRVSTYKTYVGPLIIANQEIPQDASPTYVEKKVIKDDSLPNGVRELNDEYYQGKQLSENDYTDVDKAKVDSIVTDATSYVGVTKAYYVGTDLMYQTINAALTQWVADNKPTAFIYIAKGTYVEKIQIDDGNISLVGEDVNSVIIKQTSGYYADAPILVRGGNVNIENITFIADHSGTPGFDYSDLGQSNNAAYGIHIDGGTVAGNIVVKNCRAYSYQSCALGLGTIKNSTLTFINTEAFSLTDSETDYPNAHACLSRGAVVYHPYATDPTGIEHLSMIDCKVYTKNSPVILKLIGVAGGEKYVTFKSNMMFGDYSVNDVDSLTDLTLVDSYGNNIASLNNQ